MYHTRRLGEYKETISRLFPALPRELVDAHSIRQLDALVLALFLRCYPHELSVLEVGTFFGVSTLHFASQPSVLRVLGVDRGLPEDGEARETSKAVVSKGDSEPPVQGLQVLDVARAVLAEFADESAKVELRTGDMGSVWTDQSGDTPEGSEKVPVQELSEDEPLLAFVNGARTREAVEADLQAIYGANERAIVILGHCRGAGGHFVQAGIAGFLARSQSEYHFRLFGDLTTGIASSSLGIVYPDADSAEVQRCLAELTRLFSERLDPLWLAGREQELIGVVNTYKDEAANLSDQLQDLSGEHQLLADHNTELQKRISQLEKRKSQLEERVAGFKEEKKEFQKRNGQINKRKSQLEENNSRLKEEKKGLQRRVSQLEKGSSRLEERNARLKEERSLLDSQLTDLRSAGRYRLADTVTKNVLRIPGAKAIVRRTRPEK